MRLAPWQRELRRAIDGNVRHIDVWELARQATSTHDLVQRAEQLVVRSLPYRYDGDHQRILPLVGAQFRGFAACGDAAGVVAAAGALRGLTITLCYESADTLPGYAHVRVHVDDVIGDPYRDRRVAVDRCSAVLPLADLMGARWVAAATRRGGELHVRRAAPARR